MVGPFQQAFSGLSTLNNQWYQTPPSGDGQFQTYAFNYIPGSSSSSMIEWYVGDTPLWKLQAASLGATGNIGQRPIAEEPMSIIMNLALSESFAKIEWTKLQFPSVMKFDYIRIYQDTESITCDPPGWVSCRRGMLTIGNYKLYCSARRSIHEPEHHTMVTTV